MPSKIATAVNIQWYQRLLWRSLFSLWRYSGGMYLTVRGNSTCEHIIMASLVNLNIKMRQRRLVPQLLLSVKSRIVCSSAQVSSGCQPTHCRQVCCLWISVTKIHFRTLFLVGIFLSLKFALELLVLQVTVPEYTHSRYLLQKLCRLSSAPVSRAWTTKDVYARCPEIATWRPLLWISAEQFLLMKK